MRSKRASPTISGVENGVDQDIVRSSGSRRRRQKRCNDVTIPPLEPSPPHADAIVVLGCALQGDSAGPALIRRVECGAALYEAGAAAMVLLSGGGRGRRSEAAAMRDVAASYGVPDAAMVLEPHSRNTFENAVESARLLRERSLGAIILVSDGYHLPRARLLFRCAGVAVVATAQPPSRGLVRELPWRLREIAALMVSLARRRGAAQ